jgi:hypothetical protein
MEDFVEMNNEEPEKVGVKNFTQNPEFLNEKSKILKTNQLFVNLFEDGLIKSSNDDDLTEHTNFPLQSTISKPPLVENGSVPDHKHYKSENSNHNEKDSKEGRRWDGEEERPEDGKDVTTVVLPSSLLSISSFKQEETFSENIDFARDSFDVLKRIKSTSGTVVSF